jgi:hypothetical protein
MESTTQAAPISTKRLWTGRVLTTLIVLFFIFDGVIHILKPPPVVEAFKELGLPLRLSVPIAIVELACLALYAIPQTCILGAILLTGYLGGAVAIQVFAGHPLFSQTLFPVYFAAVMWAGIYLREDRLRSLVPLRR